MKKILYPSIFSALILTACGNDGTKVKSIQENEDGTVTKTEMDVNGINDAADEMTRKIEALKKLKPLTIEQMKAMLPETYNGSKQSNYSASATMGYTMASASYRMDNKQELEVQLFDCAGEMGAVYYSTAFWAGMNYQQENDNEYTKTIDFMGGRAIENYRKDQNHSSLTYIVNDRLMVILQGENMNPDELKEAAKVLKF